MKLDLLRTLPAVLLCLSLNAAAQSPQPANRITAPIDDSIRVTLTGNVRSMAQVRFDQGPAPGSTATGRISLVLQRSAAQQQALNQYLADLQTSGSPNYHKWLSPAQYGARFGISDSDLATVESWLQSQGFRIEKVPQARNVIQFSGTIAQVQSAFHTSIHSFRINGESHFANVNDPQIPAALAPVVAGVGPLNDFHPAPALALGPKATYDPSTRRFQPQPSLTFPVGSSDTPYLFAVPADAATIYDTPNANLNANFTGGTTYDGNGVNIGIAGVSDLTTADVQNYRTAFLGETASNVNLPTQVIDGNDPGLVRGGAADEALLDTEVAGGLAPGAKIYYYAAADTDLSDGLFNAIYRAIDDNTVSILSVSFSGCEADQGSSGNALILNAFQQAAAQGISVVVSAGDGGSAGCDNFDTATAAQYGLAVNGIASTPYSVAVGGTDFDVLSQSFTTYVTSGGQSAAGTAPYYRSALNYIPEEPWNDSTSVNANLSQNVAYKNAQGTTNIVAGGGGVSSIYSKPSFQTSLTPSDGRRDVPDVSLLAGDGLYQALWLLCSDNVTDGSAGTYTDCQNSNGTFQSGTYFSGVGGTSASAPAFAGMLALVSQAQGGARLGQANYALYSVAQSNPSIFHDVSTGNNSVPCVSGSPNCDTNSFLTGYNSGTGYDMASGLGSIDVKALINAWGGASLTATSTTLQINGSTAAYTGTHGASLTFNIGVNPSTATGPAAIIDTADQTAGGTAVGPQNNGQISVPISSGSGQVSYNGLPGGTYTVLARYDGDSSDASSTSTPISVTIAPEASTTTLAVHGYDSNGKPLPLTNIPYGSTVLADAQITGTAEGSSTQWVATGTVTFKNGTTTIGTATVNSANLASFPPLSSAYVAVPAGSYSLVANYSGDASYNSSSSSPAVFNIVQVSSSTSATVSPASVVNGQWANVTMTTTAPYTGGVAPTGSIAVTANGNTLYSLSGLGGSFSPTPSPEYFIITYPPVYANQLNPGPNIVTLSYSGDNNYTGSSTTLTITNTSGLGSFTLTNSGNVTELGGQSANVTVTVNPAGGFANYVYFMCVSSGPVVCLPLTSNIDDTSGKTVSTTFSVSVPFGATAGTYPISIEATDQTGKITATTSWNVIVTALPANAGFTLTNNGPLNVAPGASSTAGKITITPANGYVGVVNLSCSVSTSLSNPASPLTCSVPGSVTISGTTAANAGLTVSTSSSTTSGAYTVTVSGKDANSATISASTVVALVVANPAIALSTSGNISVAPGATTGNTAQIAVTPSGGFTGNVNLTCAVSTAITNPNDPPTCVVPASINISGAAASTTLTVNTTAAGNAALRKPLDTFFLSGGATLAMVLFFGIPARRRAWRALFSIVAILLVGVAVGCGGGSGGNGGGGGGSNLGTTAGTYTVTVTGTDAATGKITATTTVTVTVI